MSKKLSPTALKNIFIVVISILWIKIFLEVYQDGTFIFAKAVKETGELAWFLLIFTIFISLFQKITFRIAPNIKFFTRVLPLRKWSGIFAFLIACTHGAAEISKRGFSTDNILNTAFSTHHAAIFGTISFLIMLPLFLTSTQWAIKKMGPRSWKNLQRMAHVSFIFAALHIALIHYFERGNIEIGPIILLGVYICGYIYLFLSASSKKKSQS